MDGWDPEYAVLRQRRKDLLREAEGWRLANTLRQSRKASHSLKRRRMLPDFATILASVLRTLPPGGRTLLASPRAAPQEDEEARAVHADAPW
jgi:hypothetical protein